MGNKLIVAAAGSGKTTYLIEQALMQQSPTLITTFTIANELEIRKKFIERNGCIPGNIHIQTWFSFLIQHGVKPFQGSQGINDKINGLFLVSEKSGIRIKTSTRKIYYAKEDTRHYYFTKDMKIYSDKISAFAYECNKSTNGKVIERIENIFENIYIDEIQDMAGYDLEIISLLLKSKTNILMVGDPRQVTYHTHNERKNSKYIDGKIIEYINEKCSKTDCIIDTSTLCDSYRNIDRICAYASKLYPNYPIPSSMQKENSSHSGLFLVKKKDVQEYLYRFNPVQIRYNRKTKIDESYKFKNMGEAKGLTFDHVLIYPTKKMKDWIIDNSIVLGNETRAKFYVSLTRAKFSVGIVWDNENTNIDSIQLYKH